MRYHIQPAALRRTPEDTAGVPAETSVLSWIHAEQTLHVLSSLTSNSKPKTLKLLKLQTQHSDHIYIRSYAP
ncbi:hypothetical protein CHARACLAT_026891 [Characodon lateralis]|uniref:Uncharacterized protein n=1 Tax=Characodon lateralis TaxID=208331 RepID=A0ABU7DK32_9TELE|nr:hypothetical protein [Characodon lateralis]